MPELMAVVVGRQGLTLFKEHRFDLRNLQVRLAPCADRSRPAAFKRPGWIEFPADRDRLELTELDPCSAYVIQCRRRNLFQRVRHHTPRRVANLQTRPLRLLLTGSGRCGTQTIASYLDRMSFTDGIRVVARHEPLSEYVVPALLEGQLDLVKMVQQGLGHNVEAAPYYALFSEAIVADRVIHLIRDGRKVVQSGLNRGWYQNDSMWNRLKPRFMGDPFTQACRFWRLTCERAAAAAVCTYRLEDLCRSASTREDFLKQAAIVSDGRELSHLNRGHVPAGFHAWSTAQKEIFTSIAGPIMDEYYPGWETTWH
jgi:hypothetical protein